MYKSLKSLGVQFAVLDKHWCTERRNGHKTGCSIPEVWDYEDEENSGKKTFCDEVPRYGHLFRPAYSNSQYRVLKLKG